MIKNKITVKEILEDKYIDFKNKYWDKVPKRMRVQIDETVNKADGRDCDTLIVSGEEKYKLLEAKLHEEVNEFVEDKNIEELADVMEVLFGLAGALGYSEEELLKARDKKREERGGFKEGIVLKRVL